MLTEFMLSFIEGVALILSPCILPVLPLVLSTSIDGGKRRPFGIILGFILTFALFSLVSRQLVSLFNINLDYIKYGSLILLAILGVILLSEKLLLLFERYTAYLSNLGLVLSKNYRDGFLSGILIGGLIGLVWTPCAGPILASALVQIIREQRDFNAMLLIFAFSFGAGVPMLIISLTGRKLIAKLSFFTRRGWLVHKVLGILILSSVGLIASGVNAADLVSLNNKINLTNSKNQLQGALPSAYAAPDFASSDIWLNTPNNQPLDIKSLRGKVVLVDFWTYSCINCLRTLPYITKWDQKYRKDGLVIVGVHAPEFEFEKNTDNVKAALKRYNIQYPVAMDNNLDTWTNYNNQYWPAHYLINKDGAVVYTSFGEGKYDETENNIRVLLGLAAKPDSFSDINTYSFNQTPETYLGYQRSVAFASNENIIRGKFVNYTLPDFLTANNWALQGNWQINSQNIITGNKLTKLQLNFTARDVFLVLGTTENKSITAKIKLNGKLISAKDAGKDVNNGNLTVTGHRLYHLISQSKIQNGLLEIDITDPGLEAYAFTFGS